MTNNSKLWQLRAGIITEGEYQDSMEEEYTPAPFGSPHGKNSSTFDGPKDPKMFTPDGEVDKAVTSASQLGKKFMDTSKDVRNQGSVISGGEADMVSKTMDQLIDFAADPKNKTAILQRIRKFIQQQRG